MHICVEHGPRPPLCVCVCAFKSPPFIISKQFIHACRRVQGPGGRGWAIHQSSFIRPDDDRYPSSDPELARPQSSATIWAAGISSNSPSSHFYFYLCSNYFGRCSLIRQTFAQLQRRTIWGWMLLSRVADIIPNSYVCPLWNHCNVLVALIIYLKFQLIAYI